MNILKKIDFKREFFVYDIFLFLYISSLISHKLGYGFDALYCRLTFIMMVGIFAMKVLLDLKYGKNKEILTLHFFWLAIFWGYALLSLLWSWDNNIIIDDFNWNWVIQIISVSVVICYRVKTKDDYYILLKILILSVLYMCCLVLMRAPLSSIGSDRLGSDIGINSNAFGRYISSAMLLNLFLLTQKKIKNRLLNLFVLIFLVFFLVLSGSRASILAFVAGLIGIVLLFGKSRKKYIIIATVILLLVIACQLMLENETMYRLIGWRIEGLLNFLSGEDDVDGSTGERFYFMKVAVQLFFERPILGVGLHNFKYYLSTINYSHVTYSHSNHLEILSCLGMIGHIIYYSYFYGIIVTIIRNWKKNNPMMKFAFIIICTFFFTDFIIISYIDVFYQIILVVCFLSVKIGLNEKKQIYFD